MSALTYSDERTVLKGFGDVQCRQTACVTTRWWWVRHAPVREDGGCIYGQKDLGCDTSDRVVFEAVGKILPRNAVWYASNLKRTHQTAQAIWAAGFPKPSRCRM